MSLPDSVEQISTQWLSEVLGTEVRSCKVVDSNSGTTGRCVLELEYAPGADYPTRLFVKLPPTDELQRAFVISSGMGEREAHYYRQLSPEAPVRVPRCYYANSSEDGEHYIVLLEHLEDSGCTFQNTSTKYSMDYIRAVVASFAKLHGSYWQTPRFEGDLNWLQPPVQHAIAVDLVASALEQFSAEMPATFRAMGELYLAETDAIHRLWNEGEPTVIHGDVHDGNLFFDGEQPGFLDWALVARGPGMRDVGYFLAGAMLPQDRQAHQREMLEYYAAQLALNCVQTPTMEALWQQYQWHVAYVWVGAAVTLAMGDAWQAQSYTRKTLERINQALLDLDSVSSIRNAISAR